MNSLSLLLVDAEIARRIAAAQQRHLRRTCRTGRRFPTVPAGHPTNR